jgi:hypothetical protein
MSLPRFGLKAIAMIWLLAAMPLAATAACPPAGWTTGQLEALKIAGFELVDDARRQALALDLRSCLADPDPLLRDSIAFEAYFTWLRADKLDLATRIALFDELLPAIAVDAGDAAGFRQPFSALVLAELARADRKSPYLSAAQRARLIEAGASYLESVRDYRGYDSKAGWRHGVAHGSDLLMQLALNGQLDKAQLDRMLAAIRVQVAPPGEHFYVYGEPERLAAPVLFAAKRGLHSREDWAAWFRTLSDPAPLATWAEAYRSNAGLARRHNTRAFLLVLYSEVRDSKDEQLLKLLPAVNAALTAVP